VSRRRDVARARWRCLLVPAGSGTPGRGSPETIRRSVVCGRGRPTPGGRDRLWPSWVGRAWRRERSPGAAFLRRSKWPRPLHTLVITQSLAPDPTGRHAGRPARGRQGPYPLPRRATVPGVRLVPDAAGTSADDTLTSMNPGPSVDPAVTDLL